MNKKNVTRRMTPIEGFFVQSPLAIVTIAARIQGMIDEKILKNAVDKLQQRHLNLQYRIIQEEDGAFYFNNENVQPLPIKVFERETDYDWISIAEELSKIPFAFETTPAMKVVWIRSDEVSEIVLLCHHVICDGLSLAYVMRDLLEYLGDPHKKAGSILEASPLSLEIFPSDVKQNRVVKFFINRINQKWLDTRINFDQSDYERITKAYWDNYSNGTSTITLSKDETKIFIDKCKQETISVNSAITAAFSAAPRIVFPEKEFNPRTVVAVNLRDKLTIPVNEGMGMFAGGVDFKYSYNPKKGFWKNARELHEKLKQLYTNKNIFNEVLTWSFLEPSIHQGMTFKKLGSLIPEGVLENQKLINFSKEKDVVSSILDRERLADFETIFLGNAVTNLTRLEFSATYGNIKFDRLFFKPGGAFPLSNINLLIGAVTAGEKLSIMIEYSDKRYSKVEMEKIINFVKEKMIRVVEHKEIEQ